MDFLASLISALALAAALPNEFAHLGSPVLGFVCLVPFFAAVATSGSYRRAAALGATFGAAAHALSSYWLMYFQDFAIWTIGATTAAYGLVYAVVALWLRFFAVSAPSVFGRGAASSALDGTTRSPASALPGGFSLLRPFLVGALWAVWEYGKSTGFLGYPWGLVAYSVASQGAFIQIADAAGVYPLSFLLASASALLVELGALAGGIFTAAPVVARTELQQGPEGPARTVVGLGLVASPWRSLAWPVLFFAVVAAWILGYGAFRLAQHIPVEKSVPMVLVQHNGDSWAEGGEFSALKDCQDLTREGIADLRAGKAALANGERFSEPALVAWSETVLRRPFAESAGVYKRFPRNDPFLPFLRELGVPLLTGAPVVLNWETWDATNSALLLSPEGGILYSYAKRHPVPFAEAIPFMEYPWMQTFMSKLVGLDGGWTMGSEATVMSVPDGSGGSAGFGVPICFEDAFADVCRDFFDSGAEFLVNLTNDSWSRTISAELQHFTVARFRAVEERRTLVRSTNGGYTCVIGAKGEVLADLPLFEKAVLAVDVPIFDSGRRTVYSVLGDWFVYALLAGLAWVTLSSYLSGRPGKSTDGAA